jgi:hypothetical protein
MTQLDMFAKAPKPPKPVSDAKAAKELERRRRAMRAELTKISKSRISICSLDEPNGWIVRLAEIAAEMPELRDRAQREIDRIETELTPLVS